MINDRLKPAVIGLAAVLGVLTLAACGSDSGDPATAVPIAPTSVPPAATSAPPAATAAPPAATSAPPVATTAPPTAAPTAEPTVEPTKVPTATPELDTVYSDYGFTLNLDLGADVQTTGWTESEPSETQGLASFTYGGITTSLVWGPTESRDSLSFLASSYNVLRAAQPSVTFESISDGSITVSGQMGSYGGFKALDSGGATLGGGLIGTWNCANDTAYRMTLTGADATVVQLRFDRLLENFSCPS